MAETTPDVPADEALIWPELARMGGATPTKGGTLATIRAKGGMTFRDHAKAADLFVANGGDEDVAAARLLSVAKQRLTSAGVAFEPVVSHEGFPALRILPEKDGPLLADGVAGLDGLDGFWALYSPSKLLHHKTRGDNWRYRRELFISHDAIDEQCLDPITIHEIEHTVLSRAEEKGVPALFAGNVAAVNGAPISECSPEVGGYASLLSFQEIAAYSIQCAMLAQRITPQASPERLAELVNELAAMARWGEALSSRIADVAERTVAHLRDHPEDAKYERFALTVAARGETERDAGPPVVWASVENLTNARPQVPLPHAAGAFEAEDREALHALITAHFTKLSDAASVAAAGFESILESAQNVARIEPLRVTSLGGLVAAVDSMREATVEHTTAYRAGAEATA